MKVQDFKVGDYVKLICDYEKNPVYGVVKNFYEDGTMVINDHQNGYSYHADDYTSQTVSLSTKTNFYFAKTWTLNSKECSSRTTKCVATNSSEK